jgi:hypothetical protein
MQYDIPSPDVAVSTELSPHTYFIPVDYPVTVKQRSPLRAMQARIAAGNERYRIFLQDSLCFHKNFRRIPVNEGDRASDTEPFWLNDWFSALDAISLYTMLARCQPRTFIEIGSGNSTRFARRAVSDLGLPTRLCSIDPMPRAEIDTLCDEIIRQPFQDVDLGVFDTLEPGDIAFLDGSHRVFQNSDATVFLTEVVPSLAPGVVIGIHDIFLPEDYPPVWLRRYYSEQYLLSCYLMGGDIAEILCPVHHIGRTPELVSVLDPIWMDAALPGLWKTGGMFWFTKKPDDALSASG